MVRERKQSSIRRRFLMISKDSPFQFQEAFKSLRTNIKFMAVSKECKRIVITSAIPGEGKSSVAINLALSLAEAGSRVLLMDCDLRKPIVHRYLKIDNKACKGITSALAEKTLNESIISIRNTSLHVMIADAIPPNPAELLGSRKMQAMIESLDPYYDYIIFDTPPVSVVTDAAVLSQYADGVVLVVKQNYATLDQITLAKRNLDVVHSKILGVVLNNYNIKSADKESGYYYNYNYNYDYSAQE